MEDVAAKNMSDKNLIRDIMVYYTPIIQADAVAEYQAMLKKEETIRRMWAEWREVGQTTQQSN
jgi:replication initiation and membrane attachment protein DnaB